MAQHRMPRNMLDTHPPWRHPGFWMSIVAKRGSGYHHFVSSVRCSAFSSCQVFAPCGRTFIGAEKLLNRTPSRGILPIKGTTIDHIPLRVSGDLTLSINYHPLSGW